MESVSGRAFERSCAFRGFRDGIDAGGRGTKLDAGDNETDSRKYCRKAETGNAEGDFVSTSVGIQEVMGRRLETILAGSNDWIVKFAALVRRLSSISRAPSHFLYRYNPI